MKVFVDFHHAGLLQSFILLFERRLGGEVYRPIGVEWHTRGYWKVYDHPATVQQFLGIGGATPDGSAKLNEVVTASPPVYKCQDIDSGETNKAITYEGFMSTPFDIVIASMPCHIEPFKKLCAEHPNKPKLIYQIGNAWTVGAGLAPNIMASAIIQGVPSDINFITYHQEFDLDIFSYTPPNESKNVTALINCFNTAGHFADDWHLFNKVGRSMPEWNFKSYGGQCRDGCMHGNRQVAQSIKDSRFIWHTKAGGDGYGHIIFNTGAIGRPMIVKRQYYAGKLGEALMIDGKTCIAIDGLNPFETITKLLYYNDNERYQTMCKNVYTNFMQTVNFPNEAKALQMFFASLRP